MRATAQLRAGRTALVSLGGDAGTCPDRLAVLVHVAAPRPRMPIFGAVDFATAAGFPHADEVVVDWSHRYLETSTSTVRCATWPR